MTGAPEPPSGPPSARRTSPLLVLGLLGLAVILAGVLVASGVRSAIRGAVGTGETRVTQDVVVEKMRAVAQLVTSETTLRDVVMYENRRLGSTKRSLVVVTGRVLTGFDLDRGTEVEVDHDARRIRIELPPAALLGVEVTQLRTYDEQSGLWNPFRPSDRDTIFRLAREQLVATARELEVQSHAEESARRLLQAMVSVDGYATEVGVRGRGAAPAAERESP